MIATGGSEAGGSAFTLSRQWDAGDPRATLLRREEADTFFAIVAELPESHRAPLLLHVLEEFSIEEIAHVMAIPAGTVKSRLHHAKRALRQRLQTLR